MAKSSKGGFYAVHIGRNPGIYMTWDECKAQVDGFTGARYKKLPTWNEAQGYVNIGTSGPAPPTTTTTNKKPQAQAVAGPSTTRTLVSQARQQKGNTPDIEKVEWDIVFTDGACKGNGQKGSSAGVGVWWGYNDPRNIAERCPGDQTNNRAELIAIARCLESTPHSKKSLLIKTDSQYSRDALGKWLPNWIKNNFRTSSGTPVKNKEIIQYVSAMLSQRGAAGQAVKLEYVKAHCGIEGNEGADGLANQGCWEAEAPERDWDTLRMALSDAPTSRLKVKLVSADVFQIAVAPAKPKSPLKARGGGGKIVIEISSSSETSEDEEDIEPDVTQKPVSQPVPQAPAPGSPWTRKPPKVASQTPTKARRTLAPPTPAPIAVDDMDYSMYEADDVLSAEELQRELDEM